MGGGNGDSDSGSGGGGSDALVKVIGGGGHAQGHRGMGMGMHPMTRYATFLGPPHIVGAPTYIMGSPPVSGMPMYVPGGGQPMMMGAAAGAVSHRRRRRMREENADVSESVRKCVFVEENASTVELCAVMSAQSDLGVVLEYTEMSGEAMQRVREWNAKEVACVSRREVMARLWLHSVRNCSLAAMSSGMWCTILRAQMGCTKRCVASWTRLSCVLNSRRSSTP